MFTVWGNGSTYCDGIQRRQFLQLGALGLGGLTLALLSGCGEKGPVLCEVTGQVLLKSQPLDEGMIEFEPLDGQASKSGAVIKNGGRCRRALPVQ